jgi:hypothetical protein
MIPLAYVIRPEAEYQRLVHKLKAHRILSTMELVAEPLMDMCCSQTTTRRCTTSLRTPRERPHTLHRLIVPEDEEWKRRLACLV